MTKSQTNLFSILIVIVSVVAGYLYYSSMEITISVGSEALVIPKDDLMNYENVNLDFSILDNEKFTNLQTIGEVPLQPGDVGKKNIFAP
jgi:hypothetical protein